MEGKTGRKQISEELKEIRRNNVAKAREAKKNKKAALNPKIDDDELISVHEFERLAFKEQDTSGSSTSSSPDDRPKKKEKTYRRSGTSIDTISDKLDKLILLKLEKNENYHKLKGMAESLKKETSENSSGQMTAEIKKEQPIVNETPNPFSGSNIPVVPIGQKPKLTKSEYIQNLLSSGKY
jgi:hypothetical protein